MKINLIDFILGKFKSLKNDIKLLEKNKANNIDLERLRGYNISSYEFLIVEGYPLELATYKENVEDGANSNKRYINIDKDISKVTAGTDIIVSYTYEENGEKKIYQKSGFYSTDKFIDTIQLPFIKGNPSIQISLYKNKQYNEKFEQVDSDKCSVLLNYGKKEVDIIDEIDEKCFRISIRDRNVLTKDNNQEYVPTENYNPATKKYVDDNRDFTNTQTDNKFNALNFNSMLNTGLNKSMTLAEAFPDLLNGKYDTVKQCKLTVEADGTTKINLTENYNFIQWQLYDNDNNLLSTAYSKSKVVRSVYFEPNNYIQIVCWLDATYTPDSSGSGISYDTPGYVTFMLSISKSKNTEEYINKIKDLRLTAILRSSVVLAKDNKVVYEPTSDYNPATKKYVDDNRVILPLPIHTTLESTSVAMNVVNIMDLIPGVQYSTHNNPNETKKQGYKVVYICDDGNFKTICSMPLPNKVVHLVKVLHYTNYSILSVNNTAYKVDYSKHSILTDVQITKTLQYYLPITNTIEYNPTNDYHPATKKYVDDRFICSDLVENVGTIPKEEMQKCNNGTSRYVSSIKFKEFFADYKYCVYQGTYGDKKIRMKYDAEYNRILAYVLDTVDTYDIMLGFDFDTNYMYPFNGGASQVKSYQFTNDLVIVKNDILNPSEVLTKNNAHEYTPTSDYNPATKKYVDDNILLEQLPILRVDETNKRIYVNCNDMGTYKKYFIPNKYANTYGFSFIYTNDDGSEKEIALVGGAMTRDDFILCARNTNTLFILILGGTDKYTYTKSTKVLEKGLYGYLKIGNTYEYAPTENYHPATKKYVDDKISSSPQLSFNETGELVVTINGVSKIFVPKG